MLGDTGLKELCIITLQFDDARMVELDVSHNNISNLWAIAISNCLKKNDTLQKLFISYNKITDDGIKAICDSLGEIILLKALGNVVTSKGAEEVAVALRLNKTLVYLYISCNNV